MPAALIRSLVLLGVSFAAGACSASTPFSCDDDSECVLKGQSGICTAARQCAYPDGTCPSGFRHPIGANFGLSEECADEGPSPASSTGSSTGSSSTTASTANSTSTASASTSSLSTSAIGSGSESSTAGSACGTPDEPDDSATAMEVDIPTCGFEATGVLHGVDDVDWFVYDLDAACPGTENVTLSLEGVDEVCLWLECPDLADFACDGDTPEVLPGPGLGGCCERTGSFIDLNPPMAGSSGCFPIQRLYLSVRAGAENAMCESYTATITADP